MPVNRVSVTVTKVRYECRCKDCNTYVRRYDLKQNADSAMLGHRMLQHGYTPWYANLKVMANGKV